MRWKIFFFIYIALYVSATWYFYADADNEPWTLYDSIEIPIEMITLVGFFGYAFRRPIGNVLFWKIWLPLPLLWNLIYWIQTDWGSDSNFDEPSTAFEGIDWVLGPLFIVLILFAYTIPYIALYFYGHKANDLWQKTTPQK